MPSLPFRNAPRQLALAVAILALVAVVGCKKKAKNDPPPDGNPQLIDPLAGGGEAGGAGGGGAGVGKGGGPKPPAAPAGWHEARDTVAGFRLLVPNKPVIHMNYKGSQNLEKLQATSCSHFTKGKDVEPFVRTITFVPPAGFKMGTTSDELLAAFNIVHPNFEKFYTLLEKSPVTLGGKPALKFVTRPIDITAGAKLPDDPQFAKDILERRKKQQAERTTYFVTVHGPRVVYLSISSPGDLDPAFLKTVTDSFAFQG